MNQFKRLVNLLFVFGVLIALYLWSSVYQNSQANPISGEAQISFLDVGEGDAALINLPGSTQILIDGGRQGRVLAALSEKMPRHDEKIEYVIETHPDADHIGGLIDVFKSYDIGEVIKTEKQSNSQTFANLEDLIESKKIPSKTAYRGDNLYFKGATAKVLSPERNEIGSVSSNNSSIVLRFVYQDSCAIFTGDAEIEAQKKISSEYNNDDLKCGLLKIAHHGSAGAYDEAFTQKVNPKFAVISVGENGYGHPSSDVITNLKNLNILLFRTDEKGTVNFISKDDTWQQI